MKNIKVIAISDSSEAIEQVARWYFAQWDSKNPNATLTDVVDKISCTKQRAGFVAYCHDKLVGAAEITFSHDTCWLDGVYVDESARGKGVAEVLVSHAKLKASELGWQTLYLKCEPHLVALYNKYGFEVVANKDSKLIMATQIAS
ncbi:GNAT family N-acetyltransferase [Pseudoalteromonas luteoviolacea]|uniref:GNAT family N-acetyltransferase n=1 Tax=Pseudoalteromonas luteoviolacea TaxID=43657 RepID=UPI001B36C574|nr:GNAT family N-acetyltransferase [Pseudoalteromonas luteoviolacea]